MTPRAGNSTWTMRARAVARCGCVFPNEGDVPKALRVLADFDYLHARYYGSDGQTDFNVS